MPRIGVGVVCSGGATGAGGWWRWLRSGGAKKEWPGRRASVGLCEGGGAMDLCIARQRMAVHGELRAQVVMAGGGWVSLRGLPLL